MVIMSACQVDDASSILVTYTKYFRSTTVMQLTLNQWSEGPNPSGSTKYPWLRGLGSGLQLRLRGFKSLRILQHLPIV